VWEAPWKASFSTAKRASGGTSYIATAEENGKRTGSGSISSNFHAQREGKKIEWAAATLESCQVASPWKETRRNI